MLRGSACWATTVDEAGEWLQLALDHGVNHLDIAPQYGAAESVVGPHLAAHRVEIFIAGKTLTPTPTASRSSSTRPAACSTPTCWTSISSGRVPGNSGRWRTASSGSPLGFGMATGNTQASLSSTSLESTP